jgi:hypothetical protein
MDAACVMTTFRRESLAALIWLAAIFTPGCVAYAITRVAQFYGVVFMPEYTPAAVRADVFWTVTGAWMLLAALVVIGLAVHSEYTGMGGQ